MCRAEAVQRLMECFGRPMTKRELEVTIEIILEEYGDYVAELYKDELIAAMGKIENAVS